MKTKFKRSPKSQKQSILENSNFLNNQNYMVPNNVKLFKFKKFFNEYIYSLFIVISIILFIVISKNFLYLLFIFWIFVVFEVLPRNIKINLQSIIPKYLSKIFSKNIFYFYEKNNRIYWEKK